MSLINDKGVPCFSGACSEIYLEKAFDNTGLRPKYRLKNAKTRRNQLNVFSSPTLTNKEIQKTCEVLREVSLYNFHDQ